MESLPVWLIPALTLVGGVVIGFILARIVQAASPGGAQKQLAELQERFDSYQAEVVDNFGVTAELVNKLSKSYQDVQDHLQHSAERLATDDKTREMLLACLADSSPVQIAAQPEPGVAVPEDVGADATPAVQLPPADEVESEPDSRADEGSAAGTVQEPSPEPPRDYAPRADGEPGMLDEHYGLKK